MLVRNLCTNSDLTVDKRWTNRGKTYRERGTTYLEFETTYLERGQGYQNVQQISFFPLRRYSKVLDTPRQQLAFILDTRDGSSSQTHTVLRCIKASISLVLIQVFCCFK